MADRISRDQMLTEVAQIVAKRATCMRHSVGAVIAREGRILVTGYNGPPAGQKHCNFEVCDVSKSCTRSTHAEANAIAFAAKYGIALEGADLYLTLSPCVTCAKLIASSGISRVHIQEMYRDTAGLYELVEYLGARNVIHRL